VEFLQSVVPCRYKSSEKLISHDVHNNTYNYKYTFSVEIVPLQGLLLFLAESKAE